MKFTRHRIHVSSERLSILQGIYKWSFLACLAVLPMSHTTALRNVLLALMLLLLLVHALARRSELPGLLRTARPVPWPLLAWFVFLLLFPLWAVYPQEAWANLRGQWMGSMIAWVVGFGAVWVLGSRGPGLWPLALVSAFPLAAHLLVTLAAWAGLLGQPLPMFFSFQEAVARLGDVLNGGASSWPGWQLFPLGFWGVEDMHGNLGYAAGQAIALLGVLLLLGWRDRRLRRVVVAAIVIGLCLASLLVASSRGGLLFAVIVLLAAGLVYRLRLASTGTAPPPPSRMTAATWMVLMSVAVVVGVLAWRVASNDLRWQTMFDKVQIGLTQSDPARLLCEGLSPAQEQQIREAYSHRGASYVEDLIVGLKAQDGGRILLMRVGVNLVLEHPRGQDGSRGSYKKLIEQKCGHVPQLTFAHLHQSWMDLALGLGWLGAGLFAWLLLSFARAGWRAIGPGVAEAWGFALFLLASFWFLRGFADSLYREHYLQMQALLLAYLLGRLNLSGPAAMSNRRG